MKGKTMKITNNNHVSLILEDEGENITVTVSNPARSQKITISKNDFNKLVNSFQEDNKEAK